MALANQIFELARSHDNKSLLEIESDSETQTLLDALPPEVGKQAAIHLQGALIWKAKQNRKARDKLAAAAKALDEFDVVLARGILRKIDADVLGDTELGRYDELVLALEARSMELGQLEQVLDSQDDKRGRRRRHR